MDTFETDRSKNDFCAFFRTFGMSGFFLKCFSSSLYINIYSILALIAAFFAVKQLFMRGWIFFLATYLIFRLA